MKTIALSLLLALLAMPALAAEGFKDVPKDHWAAASVNALADAGIIKGYPDGTFKGEKPVTRYELAAALSSMVQFIQDSRKPLVTDDKNTKPPVVKAHGPANSVDFLKKGGYITKDSPLLKDGKKSVSPTELAQALSSVASKLIEVQVPAPKEKDSHLDNPDNHQMSD